jgi:hypothetical protein
LSLEFDRAATFTPVGKSGDYLAREAGIYMQNNIPLDRASWANVTNAEKNALYEHLRVNRLLKYILYVFDILIRFYLT